MRFSTYINNAKCLEWGLNANQGALFDLLNQASSWAKEIVIDGMVYYWVSRNEVIKELPLFYSKPDTVYRHFVAFAEKGLVKYVKHDGKDLIILTAKGKTWNEFKPQNNSEINPNNSEINPNNSEINPNNSEINPNNSEINPNNSEINPNNSEINPTNNNTNKKNNNTLTGVNACEKKSETLILLEQFGITDQLAKDFIVHRKAKKSPITETALKGFQREADKAKIPIQQAIAISIERGWRGFNAGWDWRDGGVPAKNLQNPPARNTSSSFIPDDEENWGEGKTIMLRGN